ncbi:DUF5376 family protein [Mannheimia sp. ZY171111]|uniref:DUF5376 family protein n=1 Tax=Mannheimia sp. ZY171111 TaxID=2679995 RepID=UPI001ADDA9E5
MFGILSHTTCESVNQEKNEKVISYYLLDCSSNFLKNLVLILDNCPQNDIDISTESWGGEIVDSEVYLHSNFEPDNEEYSITIPCSDFTNAILHWHNFLLKQPDLSYSELLDI